MGRLVNKVTLSLFRGAVNEARCADNGPALVKHRNAVDGAPGQTRRAGRTIAMAALVKRRHSDAMPAPDRLALTIVLPAECYLIYQAAH